MLLKPSVQTMQVYLIFCVAIMANFTALRLKKMESLQSCKNIILKKLKKQVALPVKLEDLNKLTMFWRCKMTIKEKCDKCGRSTSRTIYEKNNGLCVKCAKRAYPEWADDPRENIRTCSYMGFENSWGIRPVTFPSYNMRGTKCDG